MIKIIQTLRKNIINKTIQIQNLHQKQVLNKNVMSTKTRIFMVQDEAIRKCKAIIIWKREQNIMK